ncbi:MAG: flagellar biosynthesis anti-sigma factor FlgM [Sideroxydans sp.]|nr:flagellar biosynthesis anti-sigma factor FlgM [Sideroxydans sp.]
MKIEKSAKPLPVGPATEGQARAPAAKSSAPAQPAAPSSTSVHLGEKTAQLQSMQSSMASAPAVDAAKVAEIKQAISEGRFQVNSTVVADRLIASVQDLLGTQKR